MIIEGSVVACARAQSEHLSTVEPAQQPRQQLHAGGAVVVMQAWLTGIHRSYHNAILGVHMPEATP